MFPYVCQYSLELCKKEGSVDMGKIIMESTQKNGSVGLAETHLTFF